MRIDATTEADIAARDAVLAALRPHADIIGAERILCVMAYTVGQLIAMQDQRSITPGRAMLIVSANIEAGNGDAINALLGKVEGTA